MVAGFSPPPALKRPLSTTVDGQRVPFSTPEGKRRLFRHSVWYERDSACPGWLRLTFWPGWIGRLPSRRPCLVIQEVCPEGELEATIQRVQVEHNVHLWLRPIKVPTTWPRGNWSWPGVLTLPLDAPKVGAGWKQVAA